MSEELENLTLIFLRRLDTKIEEVLAAQAEHGHRLSRMEVSIAGLRAEQAGDASTIAHLEMRFDHLREEMLRIKRRLDLTD